MNKRYLATITVEVYGETESEAQRNAEYIAEYTREWMSGTGEAGPSNTAKAVGVTPIAEPSR